MSATTNRRRTTIFLGLTATIALLPACASVTEAATRAAGRATDREVAERVDRGIDGAADRAEDAVLRGGNDNSPAQQPSADATADERSTHANPSAPNAPPPSVNAGFDFEPGERVLYAEDFARDNLGDFPRSMEWQRGGMEVVDFGERRFLRATASNSALTIVLAEDLPDRFTLEMDVYNAGAPYGMLVSTRTLPNRRSGLRDEAYVQWASPAYSGSGYVSADRTSSALRRVDTSFERPVRFRVMADAEHVKLYADESRIANIPRAELPRSDRIHMVLEASEASPIYVGDIRVAAGGADLYSVLEREGRFTAQGIEFDTGSDRIRGTSRPTLDQIGAMLRDHPDLDLVIEGHTDSQGSEATNLDLSERRAASVRTYLIDTYGVAPARLRSVGFGETRPVASNESAEGRQTNRRVEIVRADAAGPDNGRPAPSASSAAAAGGGGPSSPPARAPAQEVTAVAGDRFEDGTVTVTLNGTTQTLPADGTWRQWQNADEPHWLEFSVEAGSAWRQSVPGVGIFGTWDAQAGRVLSQRRIWNNELTGKQLDTYDENSGDGLQPNLRISRWEDVGDGVRAIEGTFAVALQDGGSMTGSFDLRLPRR